MQKTFYAACSCLALVACATLSSPARAETNLCPFPAHHVLIEQGHAEYPILIPPDVGANGETPQQEWNGLGNAPAGTQLTLHCYKGADDADGTADVPLVGVKSCAFLKGVFTCK